MDDLNDSTEDANDLAEETEPDFSDFVSNFENYEETEQLLSEDNFNISDKETEGYNLPSTEGVVFNLDNDGDVDFLGNTDFTDSIWVDFNEFDVEEAVDLNNSSIGVFGESIFQSAGFDVNPSHYQEYMEAHGTPLKDLALFDQQDSPFSCAVATTNMIFKSIDLEIGEELLSDIFKERGIYDPSSGTDPYKIDDVINDLALIGNFPFHATELQGFTEEILKQELDAGNPLFVGVDAGVLQDSLPPGSGHAVLLTGIVESDTGKMAIINDPGTPDGAGQVVPYERFILAASAYDNFAIKVTTA